MWGTGMNPRWCLLGLTPFALWHNIVYSIFLLGNVLILSLKLALSPVSN